MQDEDDDEEEDSDGDSSVDLDEMDGIDYNKPATNAMPAASPSPAPADVKPPAARQEGTGRSAKRKLTPEPGPAAQRVRLQAQ